MLPYWAEDWASAVVPANWLTEIRTPQTTYAFVDDPLAQRGKVLRLRNVYDAGIPTNYTNSALQLVSLYRTAANARSGYLTVSEETWYRTRIMFPSGNVFCSGDSNFLVEWHVDNNTQSLGGNSPGLYVACDFPLLTTGGVNPRLILRWASGSPSAPSYTYWPSTGAGGYNEQAGPAVIFDQWQDHLVRVIWSTNPAIGRLDWWIDGVSKVARNMSTLYTNPNNQNGASYHTFGLYNYRYNVTGNSSAYFDSCLAGLTEGSVAAA